jgi:hypothetical protein
LVRATNVTVRQRTTVPAHKEEPALRAYQRRTLAADALIASTYLAGGALAEND